MGEGFIKAEVNGFLFNAGICGLVYYLEAAGAQSGADYAIEENAVAVAKRFLLERDLAQVYIDAHIQKFSEDATLTRLNGIFEEISSLTEALRLEETKERKTALDKKYSELLGNTGLARASYISAFTTLGEQGYALNIEAECKEIKNIQNIFAKEEKLRELRAFLSQEKVKETLLMKDIIYSRINAIWSNKAFLLRQNAAKNIHNTYEETFVVPLQHYLQAVPGKKKTVKCCIECAAPLDKTTDISFLNDSADDMTRKTSNFWNCKPDAYLCPFCAFVYSLAPLGFAAMGRNLIFVNSNSSIENLIAINASRAAEYDVQSKNKENEAYRGVLNQIVQEMIKGKLLEQNNIQVIIRDKAEEKYKFGVIAKDILEILQKSVDRLDKLKAISVEISPKNWRNIYADVLENILNRRSQYALLNQLFKQALKENSRTLYLKHVINIQIDMLGGETVERKKQADRAFYCGRELRHIICGETIGAEDADNKLRGFVYQLLNALQTKDGEKFWYLVFKMYSNMSKPVPRVFLNTFYSEDELQYLGYAFILGLKNEKYNAEDKDEEAAG